MHKPFLAGLTVFTLAGTLLSTATPAHAEEPDTLYVKAISTACTDAGPGSLEQPFCTIGRAAAVATAGQTVDIGGGGYQERVTIANSGTPEQPIVFLTTRSATLVGPTAGFVIDGKHDVVLRNLRPLGSADMPALDIRDSSNITIQGGSYGNEGPTKPVVQLTGVTRSSLSQIFIGGRSLAGGLTMDATSSDVLVQGTTVQSKGTDNIDGSVGIQVDGPDNTILGNSVTGFNGAAIAVGPGAVGTEVVNNAVDGGEGHGIHTRSAVGTAITNNTVRDRCGDGIRVDGTSAGVSVQNNVLSSNGVTGQTECHNVYLGVELGIYDNAVQDTVVDYNNTSHPGLPGWAYAWNGTRMGLAAFRTASGQATQDRNTDHPRDRFDSANSAAPGYREKDRYNAPRVDNPAVADTGTGSITYADRGAVEVLLKPVARTSLRLDVAGMSVRVDASTSEPGFVPVDSYQFDFGDGTIVTQTSPVATHRYTQAGDFTVATQVSGSDGRSSSRTDLISILPPIGTVGLLALHNLRYVRPASISDTTDLLSDQFSLTEWAQFDVADAGSGQVALFSRATRKYVSSDTAGVLPLTTKHNWVTPTERFTLVRNSDGSISLRAAYNGRYVALQSLSEPYLIANQTTIGTSAKFHTVSVTDAGRSIRSLMNGKVVTADSEGAKPLIASRSMVGGNDLFDVVDLGDGQVALFAHANKRFVTAADALPLIANRQSVGTWERFVIVRNRDRTVAFKAVANGRYVTAPDGGTSPLVANRTGVGPAEKFGLH